MTDHMSVCTVCGQECYCSNMEHALGCGSSCYQEGQKIEFCSLACARQLQQALAERILIYLDIVAGDE